ncbi:cytochrome c oxidase subunit 3 family protein [Rufibacter roseus]|uniref:Cytochrome c oxidase subunit III n=1 Tax=Rufibacter roseus TaxID=1567108 RepID=A0ABW2DP61_9BACT|nr:hypothetical protein [Rufibacter roseus]
MKSENQNKIDIGKFSSFERMEKVPPLKMILYCSMVGMSVLFLILVFMFLKNLPATSGEAMLTMPKLFSVSTVLILISGFFIHRIPEFYKQDELRNMNVHLIWALGLGAAFAFSQVVAWNELISTKVELAENSSGMVLFLLSALHLLHVAGGIAFSSFLYLKSKRAASDPVRTLIYIRDPFRNMQIEMLRSYWHFLGALWLSLYFIFLFSI